MSEAKKTVLCTCREQRSQRYFLDLQKEGLVSRTVDTEVQCLCLDVMSVISSVFFNPFFPATGNLETVLAAEARVQECSWAHHKCMHSVLYRDSRRDSGKLFFGFVPILNIFPQNTFELC